MPMTRRSLVPGPRARPAATASELGPGIEHAGRHLPPSLRGLADQNGHQRTDARKSLTRTQRGTTELTSGISGKGAVVW